MTNFQKKNKGTFWVKEKQAWAELKKKKDIFWAKNWEKIKYNGQKLTNFLKKKKKRNFLGKKTSWG